MLLTALYYKNQYKGTIDEVAVLFMFDDTYCYYIYLHKKRYVRTCKGIEIWLVKGYKCSILAIAGCEFRLIDWRLCFYFLLAFLGALVKALSWYKTASV